MRLITIICFLKLLIYPFLACGILNAQIGIFSDVYIAPGNELHLAATTFFESGNILTDRDTRSGIVSFAQGVTWNNASQASHIDGFARTYNPTSFTFPVGGVTVFEPIQINDFSGAEYLDVAYKEAGHSNTTTTDDVAQLRTMQYWDVRTAQGNGQLTLSWNSFSNLSQLLNEVPTTEEVALGLIRIAGFDGQQWLPIDSELISNPSEENLPPSYLTGGIRSKNSIDLSRFTAFTLLILKRPELLSEDVGQALTPNGDGKNDTWVIEGIEDYPNAKISVYNRWGETVFEANQGYQNDWSGIYRGKSEPLPNGPYFYVIDIENDGKVDLKDWLYILD